MIHYEYFGPQGQRRSLDMEDQAAASQIGERALIGFAMVHRYVEAPSGALTSVVYFQSDVTGAVWSVYF